MKLTALPISIKTLVWCILTVVFAFSIFGTAVNAQSDPITQIPAVRDALVSDPITQIPAVRNALLEAPSATPPGSNPAGAAAAGGGGGNISNTPSPQVARDGIAGWIYGVLITIGGMFTWVGGNMLDHAVEVLVVDMGKLLNAQIGIAVNSLWEVVRDIFNILFIFALIWIGISTIINSNSSQVKQQLSGIIIAALLINFSLFITKTVIDFTNIAATQIYNAFEVENESTSFAEIPTVTDPQGGTPQFRSGATERNISVAFMSNLKLTSFADELQGVGGWSIIGFGFLVMFMMMIAGFVFLAGAILLIIRFIVLVVLMIFSPAMFLGMIFPQFGSYSKKWWRMFFSNAFVAPAYLFMLYMSLTVISGLNSTGTFAAAYGSDVGAATGVLSGGFAIFLYFGAMVGFLIMSVKVAGIMGAAGASSVESVGMYGANKLRGAAVGVGRGSAALGYRMTPYVGGNAAKKRMDKLDQSRARIAANDGSASVMDRIRVRGAYVKGAGSVEDQRRKLESRVGYAPMGGRSVKQIKDDEKAGAQRNATSNRVTNITSAVSGALGTNNQVNAVAARAAYEGVVGSQIVTSMKSGSEARNNIIATAGYLSESQARSVMDSDLDDGIKQRFATSRQAQTAERVRNAYRDQTRQGQTPPNPNADELTNVHNVSRTDLLALGVNTLSRPEVAVRLTQRNLDDLVALQREDRIEFSDYENVRLARENAITTIAQGGNVANSTMQRSDLLRRSSAVGTYPDDALRALAPDLTPTDLQNILNAGKRGQIITDIRQTITSLPLPATATQQATINWLTSTNAGQAFN